MVKIVISGTYDGFSPRYASDGILEDYVSKNLLDRNKYLTKTGGSLYREGYSFQPMNSEGTVGILFHKLIRLFDGFGRDGFMMASLFLPKGEMLDGIVIKEALDDIIKECKLRAVGGIANVNTDWSFVRRKADELNAMVRPMAWNRLPKNSAFSRTALIKGVENRIADYFQYPNPIHPSCAGYGQVFLTESLLDPAMVSDNGEQGYKVLSQSEVDIDNPVYELRYNNPFGYSTSELRHEVSKKELMDVAGDFYCGIIVKSGYKPSNVFIPSDRKHSMDGVAIDVDLPVLVQKRASVVLTVVDSVSGKAIPWERCAIRWKRSQSNASWELKIPKDNVFAFEKDECDTTWMLSVKCDQYDECEKLVDVKDGVMNQIVTIPLQNNPTWRIVVNSESNSGNSSVSVSQSQKDKKVQEVIADLKRQGMEVGAQKEIDMTVYLTATYPRWIVKTVTPFGNLEYKVSSRELERKIDELKNQYKYQGLALNDMDEDERTRIVKLHFSKSTPGSKNDGIPPKPKTWVLWLDEDSKNFSIFKNYRERCGLIDKTKKDLTRMKELVEVLDNSKKSQQKADFKKQIGIVFDEVAKGTDAGLKKAENALNIADHKAEKGKFDDDSIVVDILDYAESAINHTERYLKIPKVVTEPKKFDYKPKNHCFVFEGEVSKNTKPVFEEDRFLYQFANKNLDWEVYSDSSTSPKTNKVVRKLLPKYKFFGFALLLVVATVLAFLLWPKGPDKVMVGYKNRMVAANEILQKDYSDHYCAEENYNNYTNLHSDWVKYANGKKGSTKEALLNDSVYKVFDGLMAQQKDFRIKDSINYVRLEFLQDSMKDWNPDQEAFWDRNKKNDFSEWTAPMSDSHKKDINDWKVQRSQEEQALLNEKELKKAEKDSYDKCFSKTATTKNCNDYLASYEKNDLYSENVAKVKAQKEKLDEKEKAAEGEAYQKCMGDAATLKDCNDFVKTYKSDMRFGDHVKNVRDKIKQMNTTVVTTIKNEPEELSTSSEVFAALIYENVCSERTENFDKKFILAQNMKNYYEKPKNNRIDNIIEKVIKTGYNKKQYNSCYLTADKEQRPADKISKLEKLLGL